MDRLDQKIERHADSDDGGENLAFDFNDPPELGPEPALDEAESSPKQWSVGEESADAPSPSRSKFYRDEPDAGFGAVEPEPGRAEPARGSGRAESASGFGDAEPDPGFSRGEPAPIGRGTIPQYVGSPPPQRHSALPDDAAYIERSQLYSARSLIGLFFVVGLFFAALTMLIYGIPSASAALMRRLPVIGPQFVTPAPLENSIAVSDVQSNYQTIKDGHHALVLTGIAKNASAIPIHTVQIMVRLLDATGHELARSAVYCGTTLSPRMIGEMTPHELEFLQKLDPQKNFSLEPDHGAPFLMLFIDPPREVSRFAVAVAKAQPAAAQSGPSGQTNTRR